MSKETMLTVDKLTLSYGTHSVVQQVSFDVQRGDFLAIIGPNGSGKSTLLRALCRLHKPTEGHVQLDNRPLASYSQVELARKIALVRQSSQVSFDFTVREVVAMGRFPHLTRWQHERDLDRTVVDRYLSQTRTDTLSGRRMYQLSGGERQRVFLAQAMTQEPELLLLDEPTNHLDINHQLEMLDLVKEQNRVSGLTVIAVLHDLNLAALYADRLLVLDQGRLFADDSPEHVLDATLIQQVYGCQVTVVTHPKTGMSQVLLQPGVHKPVLRE